MERTREGHHYIRSVGAFPRYLRMPDAFRSDTGAPRLDPGTYALEVEDTANTM
jgi:hypothetical protein